MEGMGIQKSMVSSAKSSTQKSVSDGAKQEKMKHVDAPKVVTVHFTTPYCAQTLKDTGSA